MEPGGSASTYRDTQRGQREEVKEDHGVSAERARTRVEESAELVNHWALPNGKHLVMMTVDGEAVLKDQEERKAAAQI